MTSPWTFLFTLQDLDLQLGAAKARGAQQPTETHIRRLEEERESVTLLLPRAVLGAYERLKNAGVPPPWVAHTSKPKCPSCNGQLSLAAVREARGDHAPLRCESCWRLLFWI